MASNAWDGDLQYCEKDQSYGTTQQAREKSVGNVAQFPLIQGNNGFGDSSNIPQSQSYQISRSVDPTQQWSTGNPRTIPPTLEIHSPSMQQQQRMYLQQRQQQLQDGAALYRPEQSTSSSSSSSPFAAGAASVPLLPWQLLTYGTGLEAFDYDKDTNGSQRLLSSIRRNPKPKKFFKVGKVFMTLWSEPAGDHRGSDDGMGLSRGRFDELIFSKIRRFVVVREGELYCTAVPILTYNGQGLAKPGVVKSEHAVVHSGKVAPKLTPSETPRPGEAGALAKAIRVDLDDRADRLDPMSRIDFGRFYNVEHNAKVRSIGMVSVHSRQDLVRYVLQVFEDSLRRTPGISENLLRNGNSSASESLPHASSSEVGPSRSAQAKKQQPLDDEDVGEEDDGYVRIDDAEMRSIVPEEK